MALSASVHPGHLFNDLKRYTVASWFVFTMAVVVEQTTSLAKEGKTRGATLHSASSPYLHVSSCSKDALVELEDSSMYQCRRDATAYQAHVKTPQDSLANLLRTCEQSQPCLNRPCGVLDLQIAPHKLGLCVSKSHIASEHFAEVASESDYKPIQQHLRPWRLLCLRITPLIPGTGHWLVTAKVFADAYPTIELRYAFRAQSRSAVQVIRCKKLSLILKPRCGTSKMFL
jgi:hypothetical protein